MFPWGPRPPGPADRILREESIKEAVAGFSLATQATPQVLHAAALPAALTARAVTHGIRPGAARHGGARTGAARAHAHAAWHGALSAWESVMVARPVRVLGSWRWC
jgi:hypothetical protein